MQPIRPRCALVALRLAGVLSQDDGVFGSQSNRGAHALDLARSEVLLVALAETV
ncbi:hypothetical protein ACFV4T_03845 [Streptomyces sp. NPDC059755]|uniref:hypothetical protein n=1 Tax=Streptomyces sp. NPDC059755 TaxID=3346934 RepID=UPI00364AA05A